MRSLIAFELKKILSRKATLLTAAAIFALLILIFSLNVLQQRSTVDTSGEITGLEAIALNKETENAHAGLITDERITADFKEYRQRFVGPGELNEAYSDGTREVDGEVLQDWSSASAYENAHHYYFFTFLEPWRLTYENPMYTIWSVDPSSTIDYSEVVRQSLINRLDDGMGGIWVYSEAERALWLDAYDTTQQPLAYGYHDGWKAIFDVFDFLVFLLIAVCVGVTPIFAGEYRERTDAVLLATRYGKSKLTAAKILAALLYTLGVMLVGFVIALGIPLACYGADGWDLPVQLMSVSIPYALTLSQAVLALCGISLIVALGLAAFMLFLSARWRSTLGIVMAGIGLVLLPLFLSVADNNGMLLHIRALFPGPALDSYHLFMRLISYPVGPLALDLQTVVVFAYVLALGVFGVLAARTFRRHQVG